VRRVAIFLLFLALFLVPGAARAQDDSDADDQDAPENPHAQVENPHAQNPHAGMNPHGRVEDTSDSAPDLPPGTIDVTIADPDDKPMPGIDVRLGILSQKIAEGESRSQKGAKADADGKVRFSGLAFTSDKSYRVTVASGPAEYASPPFNLRDNAGHRVRLHVYPTTSDMNRTVAMGAFLSVEPRDDIIQLDMILHVFNIAKVGWIPNDVIVSLPDGFKAFSGDEDMWNTKAELVEGRGAALRGTYPPGERRVRFRFQIPKPTEPEVSFTVGLPPRVAQAQVVAAASPEMSLEVAGDFPTAKSDVSSQGDRVLYTMRMIKQGEAPIKALTVTLGGLRVPGPGRWVAVAIALLFAGFGGLAARGDITIASTEKVQGDRARARDLILKELVLVERAKSSGELGPNAYDRAHRALLDALARIGVPDEKKQVKKRKVARA
jgi:hypothetical protein